MINCRDGRYFYKGIHSASQVEGVEVLFKQFLIEQEFDVVFEIGTLSGGLTHIINDAKANTDLKFKLVTIDYSIKDWLVEELKNLDIEYLYYDETTQEFKDFAINLITSSKKICVLCDGGNKVNEFNTLAPYLKPEDFIMCHDYVINNQEFQSNYLDKIWNFHEVRLEDLEQTAQSCNLIQYKDIDFESKVWACFKKQ